MCYLFFIRSIIDLRLVTFQSEKSGDIILYKGTEFEMYLLIVKLNDCVKTSDIDHLIPI